jgi:hypothetical protein
MARKLGVGAAVHQHSEGFIGTGCKEQGEQRPISGVDIVRPATPSCGI